MSNKRNIKKQIDLNPNKEVSELIGSLDALDELNKKIPININKTLDPANNSIGLYGLADMVLLKIFDFHAV